ncbi:putative RNA-binding protein containing Zn ribbon [Halobacteroides halobius DSM 5150]|uniref:Putative RNA-binding protein containing Zn ribbon n=1 Tax=Halobacteroides halobius (strain ATCC 35273 / DSM 5150 / MD-1) TaxID=748449 RepID=L0K7E7_HALHC|nr:DUF721 domain-containing protein [Halobacteroides halobius]AGB40043.1 putative RNA-binding protein containing Zn ribbon [Halobacteroides halobius DSM 5150]
MAESIKKLLDDTLNKLGLSRRLKEEKVLNLWSQLIGDKIGAHTQAKYINCGVLFVTVDNSTWAHQLLFMKKNLIQKINQKMGQQIVKEIRFQVGKLNKEAVQDFSDSDPLEDIELTSNELNKLQEITNQVEDSEIRDKFFNLLINDQKRKKWQKINDWHPCPDCSVLISPEEDKCYICQTKEKRVNTKEVKELLVSSPWLSYQEIIDYFPQLSKDDFQLVKQEMIEELEVKIDNLTIQVLKSEINQQKLRVIFQKYVMLETGVTPDNLTDRLIKKIIGGNKMKIYRSL